jgi:hypothetical protein
LNEIDLLQRFRADVPEPDADTVQAARSALMQRVEVRPAWLGLRERRSRRQVALALGAAAAAVVTVALLLPIVLPHGATNAAAAELRRFALAAAKQPYEALGPGQYYYFRQEGFTRFTDGSTREGAYSVRIPIVREYWLGADGSGRLVETQAGKLIWPGPRDEARWEAEGSPRLYGPSDQAYGPGELVGSDIDGGELATLPTGYTFDRLPRDPQALYETIRAASAAREPMPPGEIAQPTQLGTFSLFSELLLTPLTPSDLRASLLKAMTYLPDITVVPEKAIPGMGTGAAVMLETSYCCRGDIRVRWEYLVDPATSQFLGFQETLLDRPWWIDEDPPIVTHSMAYARPAIVDSISERA